MMTFLVIAFIGLSVAAVLFVLMLPFMIIGGVLRLVGGVLRLLTLPFRLLFRPWGCHRHAGYGYGYGGPWGGPRWRRRGAFGRW